MLSLTVGFVTLGAIALIIYVFLRIVDCLLSQKFGLLALICVYFTTLVLFLSKLVGELVLACL